MRLWNEYDDQQNLFYFRKSQTQDSKCKPDYSRHIYTSF